MASAPGATRCACARSASRPSAERHRHHRDKPVVDLGAVGLERRRDQARRGADVVAEREEVVLAPDRTSYSVKNMPAASGGTAIDVLRNIPLVEVDGSNNVSLRGNANVVVQINGRSTPLKGDQLGAFLAQLPAGTVKNVEVATNPSAKDDPEGTAGIINIVLNQEAELGLSGGIGRAPHRRAWSTRAATSASSRASSRCSLSGTSITTTVDLGHHLAHESGDSGAGVHRNESRGKQSPSPAEATIRAEYRFTDAPRCPSTASFSADILAATSRRRTRISTPAERSSACSIKPRRSSRATCRKTTT